MVVVGEILTVINIIYKPIEGFSAADKSRVYKLYHKTHVYVCTDTSGAALNSGSRVVRVCRRFRQRRFQQPGRRSSCARLRVRFRRLQGFCFV